MNTFQFPSNGKVYPKTRPLPLVPETEERFNSLQTGRCIQSIQPCQRLSGYRKVSIPFKREGVSKGDLMPVA